MLLDSPPYTCPYCERTFSRFSTVIDHWHVRECHQIYTKLEERILPPSSPPQRQSTSTHRTPSPLAAASLSGRASRPQHCTRASDLMGDDPADVRRNQGRLTCHACETQFSNAGNLNRHVRSVHLNIRRYACVHCDKRFHRNSELRYHIYRVHYVVKAYPCHLCERSYSRKEHLRRHLRNDHQENPQQKKSEPIHGEK